MSSIDTRFQPGQSGNPGGRKPIPEELKNRLRNLSSKAVDALERALDSEDDRICIQAATVLLDRAYGKPAQQLDTSISSRSENEQAQIARLVERARARDDRPGPDEQASAGSDAASGGLRPH